MIRPFFLEGPNFMIIFYDMWKIVCITTMLYMIFQYLWKPVLIHRILIGFEALLEKEFLSFFLFVGEERGIKIITSKHSLKFQR